MDAAETMDADKIERMRRIVENTVGAESRQQITHLLGQIDALGGAERLLLYLKLPAGPPPADPLKQPANPLGSRAEIHQTVMWIRTHLEVDPEISLPKQDVYNEYLQHCSNAKMKPLSTADFGKVMKQVYPCVKPRRLGTRGNSRYCYAGMRKRIKLEAPRLPDLGEIQKTVQIPAAQNDLLIAASQLIREWAEKALGVKFNNLCELARHLVEKNFVQGSSDCASVVMNSAADPNDCDAADGKALDFRQKTDQRGVIKQLKRKIQLQPQSAPSEVAVKKIKTHDGEGSDDESGEDGSETLAKRTPVKKETETGNSDGRPSVSSPRLDGGIKGPAAVREEAPHFPVEYPVGAAVNLSQAVNMSLRHEHFNPFKKSAYDYDIFQSVDPHHRRPTNLSVHSAAQFALSNSNLPINLSSSNQEEAYPSKYYKSPTRKFDSPPCQNNSLNLSVASQHRENPTTSQISSLLSPGRLPLPGKKMILEAYNNENQINNQSYYANQFLKQNLISPVKNQDIISHGEYLPKKMRAAESLSGKLAASRLLANANLAAQTIEPPTVSKENEMYPQYAHRNSDAIIKTISTPIYSPATPQLPFNQTLAPSNATTMLMHFKTKAARKANKAKIDCINNNMEGIPKPATRGRPRKKSFTKAKYTRRQPKTIVETVVCDHSKNPKRSSDSCCSLTESINVKTGIICAEKHSEILNRERVSSICNMDKHALDDYLDESSSQENEEELMKYFQPASETTVDDVLIKSSSQNNTEPKSDVQMKNMPVAIESVQKNAELLCSNISDTSTQGSDFLESSGDHHDDHNKTNSDKICEIRKMLEKSISHTPGTSAVSTLNSEQIVNTSVNGSEKAFTSISARNNASGEVIPVSDFDALSKLNEEEKPGEDTLHKASLSIRRSVSFETPNLATTNKDSPTYVRGQASPISRVQHFNFMPISPGRLSPVNSTKISPIKKKPTTAKPTSPVSLNSSPSPFVSPRNTPVPRARVACQVKPVPSRLQVKKLSRLDIGKGMLSNNGKDKFDSEILRGILHETGNFIMPSEQSTISPGYTTKSRNFPMSAPPSPNILASKYKPNFNLNHHPNFSPLQSVIQMHPSTKSRFQQHVPLNIPTPDSTNDPIQPLSADPLSHEVSGFFSDDQVISTNNSIRSQSVPLNQNQNEGQMMYYSQDNNAINPNVNFMSYNNTPCNSIPATPIPREFCDFGNLNDTCESITKAGLNSENLVKIYNVLDSTASSELVNNELVKSDDILINNVTDSNLSLTDFVSSSTNIINPSMTEDISSKHMQYPLYPGQSSSSNEYLKRSNSVEMNIGNASMESKFFMSRSVPSTPLPYGKGAGIPDIDFTEDHTVAQYHENYNPTLSRKLMASKSVPSTPLTIDESNIFSYSNRDFLINGNSVDHNNVTSSFAVDKDMGGDKGAASVLVDLPETIDIVNNELAPFNEDCIDIASELPTFTEQGIASENDLLRDLEIM